MPSHDINKDNDLWYLLNIFFFLFLMHVFCLHICLCALGSQKRVSDPLELELLIAVSCRVEEQLILLTAEPSLQTPVLSSLGHQSHQEAPTFKTPLKTNDQLRVPYPKPVYWSLQHLNLDGGVVFTCLTISFPKPQPIMKLPLPVLTSHCSQP